MLLLSSEFICSIICSEIRIHREEGHCPQKRFTWGGTEFLFCRGLVFASQKLFASKRMPEFKQPANNASDGEVLSWFRGQAAEHGGSDATDTEVLGWFREQAAANGSNKLILE